MNDFLRHGLPLLMYLCLMPLTGALISRKLGIDKEIKQGQFSMRTLLIVMTYTAIAIALGYYLYALR